MIVQISRSRRFFALLVSAISLTCVWLLVTNQSITGGKLSETPMPTVVTETVTHVRWIETPPECGDESQEAPVELCKQGVLIMNWTPTR